MSDPDLVDCDCSGVRINSNLNDLCSVAEGHGAADGGAPIFSTAPGFRDSVIVSLDCNSAFAFQGGGYHLVEGQTLVLLAAAINFTQTFYILRRNFQLAGGGLYQFSLEILSRVDGGIAHHKGDPTRVTAVILGRDGAIGGNDADTPHVHPQCFGGALGNHSG